MVLQSAWPTLLCAADSQPRENQAASAGLLAILKGVMLKEQEMSNEMRIAVSIVEDDEPVRSMLADWIQQTRGFRCTSKHASAESALAALPAEKPAVVLMDINLPGISGIECVRRLKPLLPGTQFIMLTVYEDLEHIFNALAVGDCGYLLKRLSRAELLAALRDVQA